MDETVKPYLKERMQDEKEIWSFVQLLSDYAIKSYLEIGAKFGGSLWTVATSMPEGSRVVAVDLPNGTRLWNESSKSLETCIKDLQARGYDAHLIWGDSTDPVVVDKVRKLGPFDATFIDANHTLPYVRKDWANYGPMCRMVAFHDIAWKREKTWKGVPIEVPQFWNHIKQSYEHLEFRLCPNGKDNGIGVLWRS